MAFSAIANCLCGNDERDLSATVGEKTPLVATTAATAYTCSEKMALLADDDAKADQRIEERAFVEEFDWQFEERFEEEFDKDFDGQFFRPAADEQTYQPAYADEQVDWELVADSHIDQLADSFLFILRDADFLDDALKARLAQHAREVTAQGWSWESVADRIWLTLTQVIALAEEKGWDVPGALGAALDQVRGVADELFTFARDHPVAVEVFCAILAIGVLYVVSPWVLSYLGFAQAGVVEDSIAAAWQARYAGYVPKGSIFSFLQHLGATIGRL